MPVFSPHDLRHRRISLLHRQGRSWAEIGRFVGQRKLSVTADTYTHVLNDGREVDYGNLLARMSPGGAYPGAYLTSRKTRLAGVSESKRAHFHRRPGERRH
jgi:hypothetical protein